MGLPTPNTRKEQYLNAIATGNAGGLPTPITREEEYLDAIAKSGGGSGEGDMKKSVYDSDLDVANAGGISAFVGNAVSGKVDKVEGKGLSTNDYDDTEKGKVADNTEAIEAIENITGAKNFLPYPYLYTTHTTNGITFTDNGDGTITVNGVATDNARFWFRNFSSMSLGSGNYIFSCLPDNQSSKYVFTIGYKTSSDSEDVYIMGTTKEGITVNIPSGTYEDNKCKIVFCFDVLQGADLTTPVTFKPMIRDARITDPTYVPYAMTNRELTERVSVYTHGDVIKSSDGDYQTSNIWYGYIVNTSKIRLLLPISFTKDITSDNLNVSISQSTGIATVGGIKTLNNCSVSKIYVSVGGIVLDISFDTDTSLIATTPITAGIHPCTITIN